MLQVVGPWWYVGLLGGTSEGVPQRIPVKTKIPRCRLRAPFLVCIELKSKRTPLHVNEMQRIPLNPRCRLRACNLLAWYTFKLHSVAWQRHAAYTIKFGVSLPSWQLNFWCIASHIHHHPATKLSVHHQFRDVAAERPIWF